MLRRINTNARNISVNFPIVARVSDRDLFIIISILISPVQWGGLVCKSNALQHSICITSIIQQYECEYYDVMMVV
jgi:hypothetical protein